MSETPEEPLGPRRVIGTPSTVPGAVDTVAEPEEPLFTAAPENPKRAANAEKIVAALLVLGAGSIIWVRQITPDVEIEEERHDLNSAPADRAAFQRDFAEGAAYSQITKRPLLRRTLLIATAPLALAPLVLLRDLGPLPQTDLRHTVWKKGLRAVTLGGNRPLRPADISTPGSLITVIPEGYQDNPDALAKAGVILIKFEPGQLHVPTNYNGGTLVSTMNWTIDNIVAYSKICTHVGCPVALYEQTTHHILCPCP